MENLLIDDLKLDLACGNSKTEGYKGIDVSENTSADYVVDLQQYPWPIKDESAEDIICSHYIEHVPHVNVKSIVNNSNTFEEFKNNVLNSKDGLIEFFNELYRVMKVGGKAKITAPYYTSIRAFGDPTHVRYIGEFSFYYLNKQWRDVNGLSHYGLDCDFDIKYSYYVTGDMMLKSEEVREKAFQHDWNVVDDIIVELVKK